MFFAVVMPISLAGPMYLSASQGWFSDSLGWRAYISGYPRTYARTYAHYLTQWRHITDMGIFSINGYLLLYR